MTTRVRVAIVVAAALAVAAPAAQAHSGNPNFRSILHDGAVAPGIKVQVLGYDQQMEVFNSSRQAVTVYGYNGEPYARVLADGTVEVNHLSPALYLNVDAFGTTPVPKFADANAEPQWRVQDRTGRFTWHDHRMHYMAHGTPPQVKDKNKKTKVLDYTIPLAVGGERKTLHGTLFWVGSPSGFPGGAAVSLAVLVALAGAVVAVVRRRRRGRAPRARAAEEAW
jgi:hypothetical protein